MTKYIWRLIKVGIQIEPTRGTFAPAVKWCPKVDFSFIEKEEAIQDESSIGVLTQFRDSFVTKRWAEGELSGNVEVNEFWKLIYATLGSLTSTVATTGAYKHSFSLLESNQWKSFSVCTSEPNAQDWRHTLGSIDSLTITAEEGKQIAFKATIKAQSWVATTNTVSYISDYKLLSRNSIFKTATNLAGLAAASEVCLKSFEITFSRKLENDYCLNSIEPIDFIGTTFNIDGSFSLLFENNTWYCSEHGIYHVEELCNKNAILFKSIVRVYKRLGGFEC